MFGAISMVEDIGGRLDSMGERDRLLVGSEDEYKNGNDMVGCGLDVNTSDEDAKDEDPCIVGKGENEGVVVEPRMEKYKNIYCSRDRRERKSKGWKRRGNNLREKKT
ncbi:hypothetical protein ACH5RR_008944 [Cinchona calisaya]|uniref:Uncharacterized protein n=1 Tax=Cinchona calisaya TaxID=153742 RepID=A0ABD3AGM4_9GENT